MKSVQNNKSLNIKRKPTISKATNTIGYLPEQVFLTLEFTVRQFSTLLILWIHKKEVRVPSIV